MGRYIELARRMRGEPEASQRTKQPPLHLVPAEPEPSAGWDVALALRLEREMYSRVAAIYHVLPPGRIPSAEWDTYEAPINGALAAIREAKARRDIDALQAALAAYEGFAMRAAACFTEAIPKLH